MRIRDLRKKDQYKIDDAYLNGYAKLCGVYATAVYNSLSRHADFHKQECFPSLEIIAEQHRISKPTVVKALKTLEKWGIIRITTEKDEETKRQKPNIYLLLDKSEWVKISSRVNDINSESRVNDVYLKDNTSMSSLSVSNKQEKREEKNLIPYKEILNYYNEKIEKRARLTDLAKKKIENRLKTYTLNELLDAIVRFSKDKWWLENNSHRGMAWFFKSDDRIEVFLNLKEKKSGVIRI